MLYNLEWLKTGKVFPPRVEQDRIRRYEENALIFENGHFDIMSADRFYGQCAKRITRIIGNFEDVISFPVLLNYQRLMSLKVADLVCGEYPEISCAEDGELESVNKAIDRTSLMQNLYSTIIDISRYGEAIHRIYYNENKEITFTCWNPCEWFPIVSQDGTRTILKHCICWTQDLNAGTDKPPDLRLHVQIHGTRPEEFGFYEYRVYKLGNKIGLIGELESTKKVETGLDYCAIQQLKAFSSTTSIYGYDDYLPLDSILSEIMTRIGQISIILDKHADPNITGPTSMLSRDPVTGEFKLGRGKFFAVSPGEDQPRYMTWEGQLQAAFKQLDILLNQLYILSELGSSLLGDAEKGSQAISGTALRFKMTGPLSKARRITNSLTIPLRRLVSRMTDGKVPFEHIAITWRDGLPDDPRENMEIAKLATGKTSLMPLDVAIREFLHRTPAEADEWNASLSTDEHHQDTVPNGSEDPNKPGSQDGTGVNPQAKGSELGLNNPKSDTNKVDGR